MSTDSTIERYDPLVAPDPASWLATDEQERISLVTDYHGRARVKLPNIRVHAVIHVVVENQIALAEAPVARAMQRLMADGLDRHDAIHAIGAVLAEFMFDLVHEPIPPGDPNKSYFEAVERLTADEWRRLA
jgi:hypothetical protein